MFFTIRVQHWFHTDIFPHLNSTESRFISLLTSTQSQKKNIAFTHSLSQIKVSDILKSGYSSNKRSNLELKQNAYLIANRPR